MYANFLQLQLQVTSDFSLHSHSLFSGGAGQEFEALCNDFKENVLALIVDLFNPAKIRFTTLDELADDVRKTMVSRLEVLQVKLRNELLLA